MIELDTLFEGLTRPVADAHQHDVLYSAISIPGYEPHRLAKDHEGAPALLIATKGTPRQYSATRISLEHLQILHNAECVISGEQGLRETGRFSIVRCATSDTQLQRHFLRMLVGVLGVLGQEPSPEEVSKAINNLVELFRVMVEPARKTVQGFWAELLVIASSTEPILLLDAWHTTPHDVYDFNSGHQRLEVKSARGRQRQHHFALNQLTSPEGVRVMIASILVEPAGAGVSIADLLDEIRTRINVRPDLLIRLEQIVYATLGETWRRAFEMQFDRELAQQSLKFFDAAKIPAVSPAFPASVSDVHFKSDLSNIPSLPKQSLRAAGELFLAALPR